MRSLTKLTLVIIVGFGAVLGVVLYLIQPSLDQVLRLNQELKAKKIETKTLEQQILAFKTAQSDLSKATEKDRILNAVVSKEDLVGPVLNLEAAALSSSTEHILLIEDAAAKGVPTATKPLTPEVRGVKEVPFSVSTKNDFLGTLDFLRYLESSPNFTEVVDLELVAEEINNTGTSTSTKTGLVIGNFKGVFYITNETPTANQ